MKKTIMTCVTIMVLSSTAYSRDILCVVDDLAYSVRAINGACTTLHIPMHPTCAKAYNRAGTALVEVLDGTHVCHSKSTAVFHLLRYRELLMEMNTFRVRLYDEYGRDSYVGTVTVF